MTELGVGVSVQAVTVDLDDTLFPQADWLDGAWKAVAAAGETRGLDGGEMLRQLRAIAAAGSDRGKIIDGALLACGISPGDVTRLTPELVEVFWAFTPARLACYEGAPEALERLRARVPIACVTDGDPRVQRAKLCALGLSAAFDHVIFSDELGREFRKPHPAPFRLALERLGVSAELCVHIGDRPVKDVAGAAAVGMRAIRVRTGEYAHLFDGDGGVAPWRSFDTAVDALVWIVGLT